MQFTFAQDGNTFLSDETDNLIMFHGQSILDLVSMETLNNSKIVQKMLQEVPNMENATLEDLGIDFSKNSFFLTEKNGNTGSEQTYCRALRPKKMETGNIVFCNFEHEV